MKKSGKLLLLLGMLSGVSGCANLNDSPYYREWHDRAYDMRAKTAGLERDIPTEQEELPEAEPYAVPEAELVTANYDEVTNTPQVDTGAYAVDGDVFKTYEHDNLRQERTGSSRDYRYMDRSVN